MNVAGSCKRIALLACALPLIANPQTSPPPDNAGTVRRSDLEIVDCLLPGQLRRLANMTYLSRRRPARITASECWVRGGEYVAYDRADLKSALAVWLDAAQGGDPEAQTTVAEVYERGMGVEPNFEMAAVWYRKAAEQGYGRALSSLGLLYAQGQGVPKDPLKALNLFRESLGLAEDDLIYAAAAQRQHDQQRRELELAIAEKDARLALVRRELSELQTRAARAQPAPVAPGGGERETASATQIQALKRWIAQLEGERGQSTQSLAGMPKLRAPLRPLELTPLPPTADEQTLQGMKFGRYYAVVIGNQNYQAMDDLDTPRNDAQRITRILRDKYGFSVTLLEDADDMDILRTLNDLNAVLRAEDNLLIYYAGHGERVATGLGENGYWLPVNAEAPPKDTFWVPNEQITLHLRRLNAKRVLVIADSCYAGLLSNDPGYLFLTDAMRYSREYVAFKLPKRSRLLLSSGGDRPVLDTGSDGNSVFAGALAAELEGNTGILSTPELFSRIRVRVQSAAARQSYAQTPTFKAIRTAGHDMGDFFFVPSREAISRDKAPRAESVAEAVE